MSWTGSGTAKTTEKDADGYVDLVDFDFRAVPQSGNGDEESKNVIATVEDVIQNLLEEGLLGSNASFSFSASGHANADHKPLVGWSNDYLTLSIYQVG